MKPFKKTAFLLFWLLLAAAALPANASAQSQDTIFDESGVLSGPQERQVQQSFDKAQEQTGQPLYAFLVPNTGVPESGRRGFVIREARRAHVPQNAGVIVVATKDHWTEAANINDASEQQVSDAMIPDFRRGDFAAGLEAGAREIRGAPATPQSGGGSASSGSSGGGFAVVAAGGAVIVLAAALLLLRNRRRSKKRRYEEERRAAEGEFADLTGRIGAFDEKERLVGGYLEAQRPLLDQRTEGRIEEEISEARTAGFAQDFNDAAPLLTSDPARARRLLARGRDLLDGALQKLQEAESTMDDYRAADRSLDGRLGEAASEIKSAEQAEAAARAEGVSARPFDLRPEYDRLAREAAGRAARRDEFDPLQAVAAVEDLTRKARERQTELRGEVSAKNALSEESYRAEGALERARKTLGEYRPAYDAAVKEWGPAALEKAPAPQEISSDLRRAGESVERAGRAGASGRFAEARSLLQEAANLAQTSLQAPKKLKAAVAQADRKKREGEEKLKELEARLAQAKANEYRMNPYQRRQLRDYEYQLQNARYGFFGSDWLTALLLFEALDNDYAYFGDPTMGAGFGDGGFGDGGFGDGGFGGGDWGGGGDWSGGGDWGGGDWGGGGDGGFGGGGW